MINLILEHNNTYATAKGTPEALTFTYHDRYLGEIQHTFSPANGKYETLTRCTKQDTGEVVKYIKECILFEEDY